MGITAEEVAARYNVVARRPGRVRRREPAPRRARRSQDGRFTDEIVPVEIPQKKGEPRSRRRGRVPAAGTTAEKLAALKPAFKKDGTVTAGNASGINDGAAALVVTTAEKAEDGRHAAARPDPGVRVDRRRSEDHGHRAGSGRSQGRSSARASTLADIDLFELNEAFAAQSLAVVRELGLDAARVNVNGGAIALGHPIGASGARILTTLVYALRARKLRYGVASLCIGGGMGIAMAVENLQLKMLKFTKASDVGYRHFSAIFNCEL